MTEVEVRLESRGVVVLEAKVYSTKTFSSDSIKKIKKNRKKAASYSFVFHFHT